MKRYKLYFGILMITISGCEKEIKMDIPENERKLVVNGVFTIGEGIGFDVSKSRGFLENGNFETVDNAEIKLFEDNVFIKNPERRTYYYYTYPNNDNSIRDSVYNCYYRFPNFSFSKDKTYKMEISVPGIDKMASVEFRIPTLVPFIKLDTMSYFFDGNSINLQFDLQINDPPNEENFYVLNISTKEEVWLKKETGEYYIIRNRGQVDIESNNLQINTNTNNYINTERLIFTDRLFDGKLKNIILKTKNDSPSSHVSMKGYTYATDTSKYQIILRSISKDYYNYLVTIDLYNSTNGNPIAEPIGVKSNVKNGLGIVAAVNQWVDSSIVLTNLLIQKK